MTAVATATFVPTPAWTGTSSRPMRPVDVWMSTRRPV